MFTILLKSSTCLAIFMLFYKLCLEKTSAHTFKRFYLIAIILISIGIPFITFTEYIEVKPLNLNTTLDSIEHLNIGALEESNLEFTNIKKTKDYTSTILWSLYSIGVLMFLFRFCKNLYQLFKTIKYNTTLKNKAFVHVLIHGLATPHTFFNYIFLNKTHYVNKRIPKEVLIHEETHSKQKHSLDILGIEILQILFWFNPLLYFIKKDIKLNHEFLADQAVIKHGSNIYKYQKTLLAFSSNALHTPLANAFNYSSIKKRFTVMKTKTSRTALWFRNLILLPLLAILVYSFSGKTIIEKEVSSLNDVKNEIKIFIDKDRHVIIDNKEIVFNSLALELEKIKDAFIKKELEQPTLNIKIEGHISNNYLEDIKNELKKTQLKISFITANSLKFNKTNLSKETDLFFKGVTFSSDSLYIDTENGENIVGISESATNNDYDKDELLAIKIIDDKTIFINNKKCLYTNLENRIVEIVKTLSLEQKEKLAPSITWKSPEQDSIAKTQTKEIYNVLRKHKIQKINIKNTNISLKENLGNVEHQKYLNNNTKDIIIKIDRNLNIILNNKKTLFKDIKEEVNKLNPNLSIEQKQKLLKGHIIIYSISFEKLATEITEILNKDCNIMHCQLSINHNGDIIDLQSYFLTPTGKAIKREREMMRKHKKQIEANRIKSDLSNLPKHERDKEEAREAARKMAIERARERVIEAEEKAIKETRIVKTQQKDTLYYHDEKQITKEKTIDLINENSGYKTTSIAINDSFINVYIYKKTIDSKGTLNIITLIKSIEKLKSSKTTEEELRIKDNQIKKLKQILIRETSSYQKLDK